MIRALFRILLAGFFIAAGINHFRSPAMYMEIMPPALPAPMALIFISGVAEIAGGAGVLIPGLRALAGWGLIALLVAVFPANIYATVHGMVLGGHPVAAWILRARLPLQVVFITWVYFTCINFPVSGRARQT